MFEASVGYMAALLVMVSFFHVQLSHFTRHWVSAIFFVYLAILISLSLG